MTKKKVLDVKVSPAPLQVSDADYRFALNLMQFLVVPTFVLDAEGRVIIWNKACEKMTGVPASEMLGTRDHWRAFYDRERACLCDLILQGRMDEATQLYAPRQADSEYASGVHVENWCTMPRLGVRLYLAIDAGPLFDSDGHLIAVVETLRDMTVQRRIQDQLESLVVRDALTSIYNRRGFDEKMMAEFARSLREGQYLAVLMLDVDHFKAFNDRHGHVAGDECLKAIASVLSQTLQRPCDVAARYGGEEFAVILSGTDMPGALLVAERIRAAIARAVVYKTLQGEPCSVTVSIGVAALMPTVNDAARHLVTWADEALYQAKNAGRNCVVASAMTTKAT